MGAIATAPRARRTAIRPLVRRLHLWLGLSLGVLFALLGLTGSALVFYTGIDAALHPVEAADSDGPAPGWNSPVWDRALATGRARWPAADGKWTFEITGEAGPIPARYYPTSGHHADREMVWFSPDGRRILRAEPWGGYLMSWVYQLHMQLLAGEVGHQIVGWSGFATVLLLVSGLLAWWPRGSWRKALAFKRGAVPIRRLHDLHKLSGLWSGVFLILLAVTGAFLSLPAVTQALLSPAALPAPISSNGTGPPITVTQALAAAHRALADGRLVFVDVPGARDAPIRARFQVPGDPHRRFPGSYVFVDQFTGRVLSVHDIRRAGVGTTVVSWVRPLHDGSVGGMATRVLTMLLGLVPTALLITGVLHWRRRQITAATGTQRR